MAHINNILSVLVIIKARGSTIIYKKETEDWLRYYNANWRLRRSHKRISKLAMEKKLSWLNVDGH